MLAYCILAENPPVPSAMNSKTFALIGFFCLVLAALLQDRSVDAMGLRGCRTCAAGRTAAVAGQRSAADMPVSAAAIVYALIVAAIAW